MVKALSFGQRLRRERDRLGLSQAAFAEVGGVKRTTQHIYESDVRVPDVNYLENIRRAGVDLGFLLMSQTGAQGREDALLVSPAALSSLFIVVDEFGRDEDGALLPLSSRLRLFQLLCAAVKERGAVHVELDALRAELSRFTGT